jgi:hypothetical protein
MRMKIVMYSDIISYRSFLDEETNSDGRIERHEEYFTTNLDPRLYETCNSYSSVLFYHGFKPGEDIDRTVDWMKSRIA